MEASDIKRLKEFEAENRRLKQMYANLSLENEALKDILEKKILGPSEPLMSSMILIGRRWQL